MGNVSSKIKEVFPQMAILKDPDNYSVFAGRNLPSFVKDFLVKKFINNDGILDKFAIKRFLDDHIPQKGTDVKGQLRTQRIQKQLLTRFIIANDLKKDKLRFAIPDIGIKLTDGIIPDFVAQQYKEDLNDGEKWGVIKLVYEPPFQREPGHVQLIDFKPFKPYKVDLTYYRKCRSKFTVEEWIDVLLTAMEYEPDGFKCISQKLEFISRLLTFVEPRLNIIELAPKGTGKSYVFGNLSKYGWLVSGGKVTRAKLFYDKQRQAPGIMRNYDFVTFDEIQTIVFQEPSELQAALKSYLESGKTTIDNYEFMSESGMMLMGNIDLTEDKLPRNNRYFTSLPDSFRESALLDRFHGFIEGWKLPRLNKRMILKGWTLNVEYFSEILHELRTSPEYALIVNELIYSEADSDLRDLKAVQRIATAYLKLLFPNATSVDDINKEEFSSYCLEPAIRRRGIIKEQCHRIDEEFSSEMPEIRMK